MKADPDADVYEVTVHVVEDSIVTGLWCDRCLLPSRTACAFDVLAGDAAVGSGFGSACDHCEDVTVTADGTDNGL